MIRDGRWIGSGQVERICACASGSATAIWEACHVWVLWRCQFLSPFFFSKDFAFHVEG